MKAISHVVLRYNSHNKKGSQSCGKLSAEQQTSIWSTTLMVHTHIAHGQLAAATVVWRLISVSLLKMITIKTQSHHLTVFECLSSTPFSFVCSQVRDSSLLQASHLQNDFINISEWNTELPTHSVCVSNIGLAVLGLRRMALPGAYSCSQVGSSVAQCPCCGCWLCWLLAGWLGGSGGPFTPGWQKAQLLSYLQLPFIMK